MSFLCIFCVVMRTGVTWGILIPIAEPVVLLRIRVGFRLIEGRFEVVVVA